jgi:hypothetical protein
MRYWAVPVTCAIGWVAWCGGAGASSSYNIDFGEGAIPSSTYGAALQPGVWNSVGILPSGQRQALSNLDGVLDGARIYMVGGTDLLAVDDPLTSGDHEALLDDMLIGFNDPLDVCIWVEGLFPGEYEVLTYALTPTDPELESRVRVDDGTPGPVFVGGAWPGFHIEGVSYARHTVAVGSTGTIGLHSGEISTQVQSGINGLQIRPLSSSSIEHGPAGVPVASGLVFPNPAVGNQEIRFRRLTPGALGPLEVIDPAGRVVWSQSGRAGSSGELVVTWDGRDRTGRAVGSGVYFARVPGAPAVRLVRVR